MTTLDRSTVGLVAGVISLILLTAAMWQLSAVSTTGGSVFSIPEGENNVPAIQTFVPQESNGFGITSTTISDCSVLSSAGTEYVLTANIVNSADDTCMNITESDIILDCNGYSIDGTDTYSEDPWDVSIGIYADNQKNITIKNCIITDWGWGISWGYGLNEEGGVNDSLVINNTIQSNHDGLYMWTSKNNTIKNNNISSHASYGLGLVDSFNNTIFNNTLSFNDLSLALGESSNNSLVNNSIINSGLGISVADNSSYNNITGNMLNGNDNGIEFVDYEAYSNGDPLLYTSLYNFAYNNTIINTEWWGLSLSNTTNHTIYKNMIRGSGEFGITLQNDASDNNITSNEVCYTDIEDMYLTDDSTGNFGDNTCDVLTDEDSNTVTCNTVCPKTNVSACQDITLEGYYILNKSIVGNQSDGRCIEISADDVILDCDNYWMNGTYSGSTFGVFVSGRNNVIVKNCLIQNYSNNIAFYSSSGNTIENNMVYNTTGDNGIYLWGTSNSNLINNTAMGSPYGISIDVNSDNNTLTSNTANNNTIIGISVWKSKNATLTSNIAYYNNVNGISFNQSNSSSLVGNDASYTINTTSVPSGSIPSGILLANAKDNNLTGNTANYNKRGIAVYYTGSTNNRIINNTCNYNTPNYGIVVAYGPSSNLIDSNTANYNGEFGIWITGNIAYSKQQYNNVTNNIANYNTYDGIAMSHNSSNNLISGNTAQSNNRYGINVWTNSSSNTFTNNVLCSNVVGSMILDANCTSNSGTGNTCDNVTDEGANSVECSINCTVTQLPGRGGGGGGTGNTAIVSQSSTLPVGVPYEFNMANGGTLTYTVDNQTHVIKIVSITDDAVEITISSNPITALFKVAGETRQFDVNGNGINDLEITLVSRLASSAKLKVTALADAVTGAAPAVPAQPTAPPAIPTAPPTQPPAAGEPETAPTISSFLLMLVILVILGITLGGVVAYRMTRQGAPPSAEEAAMSLDDRERRALIPYVQRARSSGVDPRQLYYNLIRVGWSENIVREVISQVYQNY